MITLIILAVIMAAVYWLLYSQGYLTLNMKSAITFTGSIKGRDGCSARFTSCDGHIKRVLRFPSDRTYLFTLDTKLTKGTLSVYLMDAKKEKLLVLSPTVASAAVNVEAGKKYVLVFDFDNTSGSYDLKWKIYKDNNA